MHKYPRLFCIMFDNIVCVPDTLPSRPGDIVTIYVYPGNGLSLAQLE